MGRKRKTSFLRRLIGKLTPGQQTTEEQLVNGHSQEGQEHEDDDEHDHKNSAENELSSELKAAFDLYSKGLESIPCREIGYILRSLGQNPTEDEIIELVCEAGCDWEGYLTRDDFLSVAYVSMKKQADRLDDVKAAFRAFDHNGDGNISRDELKEAMTRYGQTFSQEECDEMFQEADLNSDGKIDWDEFLQMMLPGHNEINYADAHNGALK